MAQEDVLFEALAGTYEEFTVGYELMKVDEEYKFKHSIATHSHRASVKAIDVYNGPKHDLLVTGGTDETIHIYDLRARKECGILISHSGTVTCLRFTPDGSHLFSCSEDGSICIFKIGSWFLEKTWPKAHKGLGVLHISIHPSSKLALSIGADKTLRTWNLIKGRPAYTVNLATKIKRPEIVEWSLCGDYYGLVNEEDLIIYTVEKAAVKHTLNVQSRISNIRFMTEGKVSIADWSGTVSCYLYKTAEKIWEIKESSARLKTITSMNNYLISVDGEGIIRAYESKDNVKPKKLSTFETNCRIICIAISKLLSESERPPKKRKLNGTTLVKEENEPVIAKRKSEGAFSNGVICTPKSQSWVVEDVKT